MYSLKEYVKLGIIRRIWSHNFNRHLSFVLLFKIKKIYKLQKKILFRNRAYRTVVLSKHFEQFVV